jgi:hybrid cluster-associated redox disulfide protein
MSDGPVSGATTIAEVLSAFPAAARVLVARRMHCVGCDVARFETLADACAIYGIAIDELIADLQRAGVPG